MTLVWVCPALPHSLFTSYLPRASSLSSHMLIDIFYLFSSENSLCLPSTRVRYPRYLNYRAIENNTYWLFHWVCLSWRSNMFSHWASPLLRTPGRVCSQGHSIIFPAVFCKAQVVPAVALSVVTKQSIFSTLSSNGSYAHTQRPTAVCEGEGNCVKTLPSWKVPESAYVRQCANGQNRNLEYWLLEVE